MIRPPSTRPRNKRESRALRSDRVLYHAAVSPAPLDEFDGVTIRFVGAHRALPRPLDQPSVSQASTGQEWVSLIKVRLPRDTQCSRKMCFAESRQCRADSPRRSPSEQRSDVGEPRTAAEGIGGPTNCGPLHYHFGPALTHVSTSI
jgi:hypothetical protein